MQRAPSPGSVHIGRLGLFVLTTLNGAACHRDVVATSARDAEQKDASVAAPAPLQPGPPIPSDAGARDASSFAEPPRQVEDGAHEAGMAAPRDGSIEAGARDGEAPIPGEGGVSSPPSDPDGPVVSSLEITPDPDNVLGCIVTFATDVPARVEMKFGLNEPEFRIRSPGLRTEHRIVVIGMHPETEYLLRVIARGENGVSRIERSFATGVLPAEVPVPELTVTEPEATPGWTLTNAQVDSGASGEESDVPAVIVMYDERGIPVWYHVNGDSPDTRGDVSVDLTARGTLLIGPAPGEPPREIDLEGNVVWEGPDQPSASGDPIMTHEAERLDDGSTVVLRNRGGATVERYDEAGALTWSWTLNEHLELPLADGDRCHANAVHFDLVAETMVLNCRFLGLYEVSLAGDEPIRWLLSGEYSDVPGDFSFEPTTGRFSDAHDPEFHEDGTLLLYDNGVVLERSRVVEYALDEANRVATLSWEFPGDFAVDSWYREDWYTRIWGDADRLPTGNVLVTAGMRGEGTRSRIFEVTRDGRVVWEIVQPDDTGAYRAERIVPPIERIE